MHQRSCRVFNGLDENLTDMVPEDILGSVKNEEIDAENENLRNQTVFFARKRRNGIIRTWSKAT